MSSSTATRPTFQFTLRRMLWIVLVMSAVLVAWRQSPGRGMAVLLLSIGYWPLFGDLWNRPTTFESSAHLLVGALLFQLMCGAMLLAAYLGWVSPRSGVLDYVAFAGVTFGLIFAALVKSASTLERPCRTAAIWGYFATLAGALMLNSALLALI